MGFLSWANGSSTQPTQQQPPQVFDRPWYGTGQNSSNYERDYGVSHKRYIPGAGWVTMGKPGQGKPPAGFPSAAGRPQLPNGEKYFD